MEEIVEHTPAASSGFSAQLARRARSMSGWLRFIGVVTIAASVPSVLTVFGIVFAWLPIWLGLLLFQAGTAARRGDEDNLLRLIEKLRLYFIIQGVVIVLALILLGLSFLFFGGIVFEMIRDMGSQGPTWEV